ncbi:MAG: hypothetical protein WBW07_10780, partial [Azonexus sp.]
DTLSRAHLQGLPVQHRQQGRAAVGSGASSHNLRAALAMNIELIGLLVIFALIAFIVIKSQ